jgi:ParB family chromosome partitioning protein
MSTPTAPRTETPQDATPAYFDCPVERIEAMVDQPRQYFDDKSLAELTESIRQTGIIQPLVVRRAGDNFSLIAGERRLRAAKAAGLRTVPVVVREDVDMNAFELALIENIQRQDLNALEEARAYERLLYESGLTQDQLADRIGKSRSAISNTMRLLKLPPAIASMVADGSLSAGHARAILSVEGPQRELLAERVLSEELTVRDAEDLAREIKELAKAKEEKKTAAGPRPAAPPMRPQLKRVVEDIRGIMGQKVDIKQRANGAGRLEIHFKDEEALRAIVDRLMDLRG